MPMSERAGRFVTTQTGPERVRSFFPAPLPPRPPLRITSDLQSLLDRANQALGRLDGLTTLLPSPDLFLFAYVRKEAVLSSQIEGTQSSLSDLLLFELDVPSPSSPDDTAEASHYIAAMNHGLERLAGGFPLSLRLIREMHALLLRDGRGSDRAPGEFRRSQNWIGGTRPATARYVPPPAHEVMSALGALERFLHNDPEPTPILIKTALAHVQFETIHPFLDGNGRIGRLLITLLLCADGILAQPLLYLSLYLKRHRALYYDLLQRVRTEGVWEEWLEFFIRGVIEIAVEAAESIRDIFRTIEDDRARVLAEGRSARTDLAVLECATRSVIITPAVVVDALGVNSDTAYKSIGRLEALGVLREMTGRRRNRAFAHGRYLDILTRDMAD